MSQRIWILGRFAVLSTALLGLPGCAPDDDDRPPPEAILEGSWRIEQSNVDNEPVRVLFTANGDIALVVFRSGSSEVRYTGDQVAAEVLLVAGRTLRVEFDNRVGATGVVVQGRYQFLGELNGNATQAVGSGALLTRNLAGGVVADDLGPATMIRE